MALSLPRQLGRQGVNEDVLQARSDDGQPSSCARLRLADVRPQCHVADEDVLMPCPCGTYRWALGCGCGHDPAYSFLIAQMGVFRA